MTSVIKKSSKGEFIKSVIITIIFIITVTFLVRPQFVWVNWVEIRSVCIKFDFWLIWCFLSPQICVEIYIIEERMGFNLIGSVPSYSTISTRTQRQDQVSRFLAQTSRARDGHELLPVDHLILSFCRIIC